MGRIRTIKPAFFEHETLSALRAETHLLAAGLLCYADDEGYFNANTALVKAAVFPVRETSVSIHHMLTELVAIGFLRLGMAADGRCYGQVVKFATHQRVNRRTASRIKDLQINWAQSTPAHLPITEHSLSTHEMLSDSSHTEGKGREVEGNGKEVNHSTTAPPTVSRKGTRLPDDFKVTDQHREFAKKHGLPMPETEIEAFRDYWRAVPGQRGLKLDWDATFRNRLREVGSRKGNRNGGNGSVEAAVAIAAFEEPEIKPLPVFSKAMLERREQERREGLTRAAKLKLRNYTTHPLEAWEESGIDERPL